jgi:hypothetical protein
LVSITAIAYLACGLAGCGTTQVTSESSKDELARYMATNYGVDKSQIVITDITKEPMMAGVAGNKYYFNVELLPSPDGSYPGKKQRCQLVSNLMVKSLPICSDMGDTGVKINQSGLQINTASSAVSQPAATEAGAPSYGKPDPRVWEAQTLLTALGYQPGPADGLMGPRTGSALREFQVANGLSATGQADPETLVALRSAEGSR